MTPDALLAGTFDRWQMLLTAWNVYVAVGVAVVTLFAVSPAARGDARVRHVFVTGFLLFAVAHLLGLLYMLKQWAAVAGELRRMVESTRPPDAAADFLARFESAGVIDAPEPVWVLPFHLLGDGFVVAAVGYLSRPPRPGLNANAAGGR